MEPKCSAAQYTGQHVKKLCLHITAAYVHVVISRQMRLSLVVLWFAMGDWSGTGERYRDTLYEAALSIAALTLIPVAMMQRPQCFFHDTW